MKPRHKHAFNPAPDFATRQELVNRYVEAEEDKTQDGLEPIKFRNVVAISAAALAVMIATQVSLVRYIDK